MRSELIDALLARWRSRSFVYGEADCCQFIADGVLALTGVDHRAKFRQYAGLDEAETLIDEFGGLVELVQSALGEPIHPCRAMAGNPVVFIDERGVESAGICLGARIAAPGKTGLVFPSMSAAKAAWAI